MSGSWGMQGWKLGFPCKKGIASCLKDLRNLRRVPLTIYPVRFFRFFATKPLFPIIRAIVLPSCRGCLVVPELTDSFKPKPYSPTLEPFAFKSPKPEGLKPQHRPTPLGKKIQAPQTLRISPKAPA